MRLLDRKTLAILPAASTDQTRLALNGALIRETDTGVEAIATDGRTLAIVKRTDGAKLAEDYPKIDGLQGAKNSLSEAIIPTAALADILKAIPKRATLPILQNAAVVLGSPITTLATTDLEHCTIKPTRIIEGHYPQVEHALPKGEPVFRIAADGFRLAEALKMAAQVSSDETHSVTLSFFGEENPIKIEAHDSCHDIVVAVMPLRLAKAEKYPEPESEPAGPLPPDNPEPKQPQDAPPAPPAPPEPPAEPTATGPDGEQWPVISSYSRAQAIEDGELADLTNTSEVKEAGIKYPLAVTRRVFELLEVHGKPGLISAGQSLNGRLWDMLTIMKWQIQLAAKANRPTDRIEFAPLFVEQEGEEAKAVKLVAVCGPGDTAAPVITVMYPDED